MEYKGYWGSIDWSEEDGVFYGKVMNTKDLISYEGRNLEELEEDFRGAIDEWEELKNELSKRS